MIVLRYVDVSFGCILEHFITNCQLFSWKFINNLTYCKQVFSQEYDGASVMSRRCCGVPKWIREVVLQAKYIHCYAHNLNLTLVDCVKNNCDARFFCCSNSSTPCVHLYKQSTCYLYPKQKDLLTKLSDTRWAVSIAIHVHIPLMQFAIHLMPCPASNSWRHSQWIWLL